MSTSPPSPLKSSLGTLGWIALWLVVFDVLINLAFVPPTDNRKPSSLVRYFDYGRSIEGKLERMVQTSSKASAPIIEAGWLAPAKPKLIRDQDDDLLVAVYGMSFTEHAATAMAAEDQRIALRMLLGPAAPPSHSFAAWQKDQKSAKVAVLGILASSVVRLGSISGMNWTYEHPAPYTYPRYKLGGSGALEAIEPLMPTQGSFREAFLSKDARWTQAVQQMRAQDEAFDPFVFYASPLDRSALVRLVRRAWANRVGRKAQDAIYSAKTGFDPDAETTKVLIAIVERFAQDARAAGQKPVLALFHDQGYADHLYRALAVSLKKHRIAYVSTHTLAPAKDPSNYLSDGHFTEAANAKIAAALRVQVRTPSAL